MILKEQINKHVKEAEDKITKALQILHNETGLIPTQVKFSAMDIREMEDFNEGVKPVIITSVYIKANT
jgi:hypothetical protein